MPHKACPIHKNFFTDTVTPPTAALDDHLRSFVAGFEALFQTRLMSRGGGGRVGALLPQSPPPPPPVPPGATATAAAVPPPPALKTEDAAAFFDAAGGGVVAGPLSAATGNGGAPPPALAPPPAVPVTASGHVDVAALHRELLFCFFRALRPLRPFYSVLHPQKCLCTSSLTVWRDGLAMKRLFTKSVFCLGPLFPYSTGRCVDLEAQTADARALADKLQCDLQDLSGAYATLEAHAADLEGRVGGAGAFFVHHPQGGKHSSGGPGFERASTPPSLSNNVLSLSHTRNRPACWCCSCPSCRRR